jgi:predicted nucleic acid-binding protein
VQVRAIAEVILADTSVWVDHLRSGDARLAGLLQAGRIVGHAFVVAEIALGSLRDRVRVLRLLDDLPALPVAGEDEVRLLIERRRLFGRGIGFVDASLLASCLLEPGSVVWTRDRTLDAVARDLGLSLG